MFLYYITDRAQFAGDEPQRRQRLLRQVRAAAEAGVDFIQLREKDLRVRDLETLAREAQGLLSGSNCRLLVNSRVDVAIAVGTAGVHLPADNIAASEARAILAQAGVEHPIVAVSCHSLSEIACAESHGADFAVYGPVFGKGAQPGIGVEALRDACARKMPVLALGGVTLENAAQCMAAGAAGVAGIRLFQQADIQNLVARLRALAP